MLEDRLLIWKYNRGNREVLCRVYEKYKHDLLTLATALLHDVGVAEDVVHDVFVSFAQSAEQFRLSGSLKGYLATCVANRARNVMRARQRQSAVGLDEAEQLVSDSTLPDVSAIFGEELHRLGCSLIQLPYAQREVIILHLCSGMRFREIAQTQDVSINTVQSRYRYGLEKLRLLLDGEVKK